MQTIIAGEERRVVFELVSGTLVRKLDGASSGTPLVTNVTTTNLFCYDPPDCTLTAPPAAPTSVRVVVVREPDLHAGGPITLATDVELRNL